MKNINKQTTRKHMSSPIHPPSPLAIELMPYSHMLLDSREDFKSFLLSTNPCHYYHDLKGNIIYGYTCLKEWVTCLASYDENTHTLSVIDIVSLDKYLNKLAIEGVCTC